MSTPEEATWLRQKKCPESRCHSSLKAYERKMGNLVEPVLFCSNCLKTWGYMDDRGDAFYEVIETNSKDESGNMEILQSAFDKVERITTPNYPQSIYNWIELFKEMQESVINSWNEKEEPK